MLIKLCIIVVASLLIFLPLIDMEESPCSWLELCEVSERD